jgi:hypothetical protein
MNGNILKNIEVTNRHFKVGYKIKKLIKLSLNLLELSNSSTDVSIYI